MTEKALPETHRCAPKTVIVNLARRIVQGFYENRLVARLITSQFHRLYYYGARQGRPWHRTSFLGVPILKCPFDLWVYQELIHEIRPEVIVECGTGDGGSALYLAFICDAIGCGNVLSIDDRVQEGRPRHDRITYIEGSSTSPEVLDAVQNTIDGREPVLVILDSDHSRDHVLEECRSYGPLVTNGSYLIVEDTNINGHPVSPHFGPGPMEAVDAFLGESAGFIADRSREKHHLSFNPRGYLRKTQ